MRSIFAFPLVVLSLLFTVAFAQAEPVVLKTKFDKDVIEILTALAQSFAIASPNISAKDSGLTNLEQSQPEKGIIKGDFKLAVISEDPADPIDTNGDVEVSLDQISEDTVSMKLTAQGSVTSDELLNGISLLHQSICKINGCKEPLLISASETSLPASERAALIIERFKASALVQIDTLIEKNNLTIQKNKTAFGKQALAAKAMRESAKANIDFLTKARKAVEIAFTVSVTSGKTVLALNMAGINEILTDSASQANSGAAMLLSLDSLEVEITNETTTYSLVIENEIPSYRINGYDKYLASQQEQGEDRIESLKHMILVVGPYAVGRCSKPDNQSICLSRILESCPQSSVNVSSCVDEAKTIQALLESKKKGGISGATGVLTSGVKILDHELGVTQGISDGATAVKNGVTNSVNGVIEWISPTEPAQENK
jgi:hypothetical protein